MIDAHLHLSERKDDLLIRYAKRNGLRYTLQELLGLMEENGVERGLLLSPLVEGGVPLPNPRIVELCRRSGGRLSPVFTVEPRPDKVREAVSLAKQSRNEVKAFKVMLGYAKVFANDPVFDRLYQYAEAEGLPVLFHTGDTATADGSLVHSHPLTLDALANERPGLKVVACHFGNPWFDDVAELLYKHENVYADLSGLVVGGSKYELAYTRWLAAKIGEAVHFSGGAEKVIFGTDYPVTTYGRALKLVRALEVDAEDKEKILGLNAKKVFGL